MLSMFLDIFLLCKFEGIIEVVEGERGLQILFYIWLCVGREVSELQERFQNENGCFYFLLFGVELCNFVMVEVFVIYYVGYKYSYFFGWEIDVNEVGCDFSVLFRFQFEIM